MTKTENGPAPPKSAGVSLTPARNPRYANWARVNGRTPDGQLEQDRRDWPGASMVGFTQWNRDRLVEYSKVNPKAFFVGQIIDHEAYDAWLSEWTPPRD